MAYDATGNRSVLNTAAIIGLGLLIPPIVGTARAGDMAPQFKEPPFSAAMTNYWVWFGPAVTREMVDRDLANMKQAHISGTVLLPVYPLSEDDPANGIRNLPILSDGHLDILAYAGKKSRELGMTFDVTLGTGWPYGGPWITPELAARMIRMRPATDKPKPGEELVATFGDKIVVAVPTGMVVKRASIGNEGLVLDHYNPKAIGRHLDVLGVKYAAALRGSGARFWSDSLEVFESNWTPGFLDSFKQKRGYDLAPKLDKLFDNPDDEARQLRHDFWKTLSELAAENYLRPLQQWCHENGTVLRGEAYGQPPVALDSWRFVDLPCGEHYEWRVFNASRWASSGGHLYGKNVIGAEAWTQLGYPNRFADSLEQLKFISDMHFVSGVNALMATGYYCTPPSVPAPGWLAYCAPWFNHHQTWWPYFPLLCRYIQRASFLLQQGKPVADIAIYLPVDDVFADTPASSPLNLYMTGVRDRLHGGGVGEFGLKKALTADTPVVSTLIKSGYAFDGIDSTVLPKMELADGHLRMGLCDFRVVVLPNLVGMPLADLKQLAEFVKSGGCVIATRRLPSVAYGRAYRQETEELRQQVKELFAKPTYGRGKALFAKDDGPGLRQALHACLAPDLQLASVDGDIGFVHRSLPDADFYFVANLDVREKALPATFRAAGPVIELWDAMTGEVRTGWDGTLRLAPFGSIFVRVAKTASAAAKAPPASVPTTQPVAGPWKLNIAKKDLTLDRLVSWTDIEGMRNFSGTATYQTEVELDPSKTTLGRVVLDLGSVRDIAEAEINGRPAGVVWMRPYRLDVTGLLVAGKNAVTVKVTNLWINGLLGQPKPDYSKLNAKFGERFPNPQEWDLYKPLPSGLLGPVILRSESEKGP